MQLVHLPSTVTHRTGTEDYVALETSGLGLDPAGDYNERESNLNKKLLARQRAEDLQRCCRLGSGDCIFTAVLTAVAFHSGDRCWELSPNGTQSALMDLYSHEASVLSVSVALAKAELKVDTEGPFTRVQGFTETAHYRNRTPK